mmetsp:Transcript_69184/g.144500  ORF Transcript_69184/g.144500 Transcript_69184/m.144500 type:complete len:106 (-) Transcript_69184:34-351(-)
MGKRVSQQLSYRSRLRQAFARVSFPFKGSIVQRTANAIRKIFPNSDCWCGSAWRVLTLIPSPLPCFANNNNSNLRSCAHVVSLHWKPWCANLSRTAHWQLSFTRS